MLLYNAMDDVLHSPGSPENPENEFRFNGIIRDVRSTDLEAIQPIFDYWMRDGDSGNPLPEEVSDAIAAVDASTKATNGRKYVVAGDLEGNIVGVMGMVTPGRDMLLHTSTDRPVEFLNAYVDPERRNKGIGRALAGRLEEIALQAGHTEIIVNSGPRYKDSGWIFWTRLYGEPITTQKDYYGPGADAKIWRKLLK
jgi:GNAT superfamily N-acetyltransferase